MQRIRYRKTDTGNEISPELLAGQTLVAVTIRPDLTYVVADTDTGEALAQGQCKTRQAVLKRVKTDLINLGVVFEDEIRNKLDIELTV